jgi:hypothetical protein
MKRGAMIEIPFAQKIETSVFAYDMAATVLWALPQSPLCRVIITANRVAKCI